MGKFSTSINAKDEITPSDDDNFPLIDDSGNVIKRSRWSTIKTALAAVFPTSATLTTDGDLLTRAAGVPARISRADLAADAAFAGTYAPLPAVVGTAGQVLAIDTADPLVTEWVTGGGGGGWDGLVAVNAQVAAYTLALTDVNKAVEVTSATPVDVTVPPNASVAFDVGTVIEVAQLGAGQVSIVGDTGVTVNSRGGLLDIAGQYGAVSLRKQATNTWLLVGDLA